jgi:hypothetical protein
LAKLVPPNALDAAVVGTKRSIGDLLKHAATIPEEAVLLLRGETKAAITKKLHGNASDDFVFWARLDESMAMYGEYLATTDLLRMTQNADGTNGTELLWNIEIGSRPYLEKRKTRAVRY